MKDCAITAIIKKDGKLWGYEETCKGQNVVYKLGNSVEDDQVLSISLQELEKKGYEIESVYYEKMFFKDYPRWMID